MLNKFKKPSQTRKPYKKFIAYVVFGLISLVFVFFGVVPSQFGLQQGGAAAYVNRTAISVADYLTQKDAMERQYGEILQQLPEQFRESQMSQLRERALEQLVESELLYQEAIQKGFRVSDREVLETIRSIPAFNEEGVFRRDLYQQYLDAMRLRPAEFEKKVKKDLIVSGLRRSFVSSMRSSPLEQTVQTELEQTKINLEFVEMDLKKFESEPVDAKALEGFLASAENMRKAQKYYADYPLEFEREERVRARHILKRASSPEERNAAKSAIEAIREKVNSSNFAEIAKVESEDPMSAKKGGDLDFFGRGQMVPEFEEVAFKLEPGEISEIVESNFGFHLIEVLEREEGGKVPFEEARSEIVTKLLAKERSENLRAEFKELLKLEKAAEFSAWAKKQGLEWQETGKVSLNQDYLPKLGQGDLFFETASRIARVGEMASEPVEQGGKLVALRLKEVEFGQPQGASDSAADLRRGDAQLNEAFGQWLEHLKKNAKIQRNQGLISRGV